MYGSIGTMALGGAAIGGMWGALPGDGTMLGGALGGAALGVGGGLAANRLMAAGLGLAKMSGGRSSAAGGWMTGSILGGAYGFFAGDETVTSGALKGGMLLGGIGGAAGRYGSRGMRYWNAPNFANMAPGAKVAGAGAVMGNRLAKDIGQGINFAQGFGAGLKSNTDAFLGGMGAPSTGAMANSVRNAVSGASQAAAPHINAGKAAAAQAQAAASARVGPTVNKMKDKVAAAQAAVADRFYGSALSSNGGANRFRASVPNPVGRTYGNVKRPRLSRMGLRGSNYQRGRMKRRAAAAAGYSSVVPAIRGTASTGAFRFNAPF